MKRVRNDIGNWLLVGAALIFSLLLTELAIRIVVPQVGWTQIKDLPLGWSSREYRSFVPSPKSNYQKRILFLGDSFLAGSGVSNLGERFPTLAGEMLGAKVDIAIFASGGWGTDQQLLAFREKGKSWSPELVVVAFSANNDISNIFSHHHGLGKLKPYFEYGADFELELRDGHGHPFVFNEADRGPADPLWRSSYLLSYAVLTLGRKPLGADYEPNQFPDVDEGYKQFRFWEEKPQEIYDELSRLTWSPQMGVNHVSAYIKDDFENNTYQWRLFEDLLRLLKIEVESVGADLAVVLLPVIFNPSNLETVAGGQFVRKYDTPAGSFLFRSKEPADRLAAVCRRNEILFFDPTTRFIEEIDEGELFDEVWPDVRDRHFSAVGHRILAHYVAEWIRITLELPASPPR